MIRRERKKLKTNSIAQYRFWLYPIAAVNYRLHVNMECQEEAYPELQVYF